MGNCFKGCRSEENQARRRTLNGSDSQYEMLVEGTQQQQENKKQSKSKASFFSKFWKRKDVEYSRLNKSNNNFLDRSKTSNHQKSGSEIQLQCLDAHSLLLVSKDCNTRRNGYQDLNNTTDVTSTPGSSLDLEWENDYGASYSGAHWAPRPIDDDDDDRDDRPHSYPNPLDPVFKVEEWSTIKRSKDRINSIRRQDRQPVTRNLEHPPAPGTPSIASCGSYAGSSSHISTPEGSLEWDIDQDRQLKSENESLDLETKELLLEIEQLKNRVLNETGANIKDLKFDESIS